MRWTDEEIKNAGLVEDGKGNLVRKSRLVKPKVAPRVRPNGARPMPELEPVHKREEPKGDVKNQEGGENQSKECDQFRIIITSYRIRDFDPDNINGKIYIDELVHRGILPGDSGSIITGGVLKLTERVKTESEERTEIRIEKLCR